MTRLAVTGRVFLQFSLTGDTETPKRGYMPKKKEKLDPIDQAHKESIFVVLKNAGVKSAVVSYSGSGDSGDAESVTYDPDGTYENITVPIADNDEPPIVKSLDEALIDYAMHLIEDRHGGWENNDGGSGEVTFDVKKGSIHIEHHDYYTESTVSEHSL